MQTRPAHLRDWPCYLNPPENTNLIWDHEQTAQSRPLLCLHRIKACAQTQFAAAEMCNKMQLISASHQDSAMVFFSA